MSNNKNPTEIKLTPHEGGRDAITRIIEAYGFDTRQQLCDHLRISKSTLANRWLRDTFPFDWIIVCSIETKASLTWLMTGSGHTFNTMEADVCRIDNIKLINGSINKAGYTFFDLRSLTKDIKEPVQLIDGSTKYVLETTFTDINEGLWLIGMDGTYSLKKIHRLPNKKIKVSDSEISFECNTDDIKPIGRVAMTTTYN